MKFSIIILITIIVSCKTKISANIASKNVSNIKSLGNFNHPDSAYINSIHKDDFPQSNTMVFDQSASVNIKDINRILKIVKKEHPNLLFEIGNYRIMINMILDRNGVVNKIFYKVPNGLNIKENILNSITNSIKSQVKADIINMHQQAIYVQYLFL